MTDREKILAWLNCHCQGNDNPDCGSCPFQYSDCAVELPKVIKNLSQESVTPHLAASTLTLLQEQNSCENCAIAIEDRQLVVRCKDCKYYRGINEGCGARDFYPPSEDWFCADGERR